MSHIFQHELPIYFQHTDSHKLGQDLQKVEQLESKITSELESLKQKIEQQTADISKYSNTDKVRSDAEARKTVRKRKKYYVNYMITHKFRDLKLQDER